MSKGNPLLDQIGNNESHTVVTTSTPGQGQQVTKTITTTKTSNISTPAEFNNVNNVLPLYEIPEVNSTKKETSILNLNPGGQKTQQTILNIGGNTTTQKTTQNVVSTSSNAPLTYTTKVIDVPMTTKVNTSTQEFKGLNSQLTYKSKNSGSSNAQLSV